MFISRYTLEESGWLPDIRFASAIAQLVSHSQDRAAGSPRQEGGRSLCPNRHSGQVIDEESPVAHSHESGEEVGKDEQDMAWYRACADTDKNVNLGLRVPQYDLARFT